MEKTGVRGILKKLILSAAMSSVSMGLLGCALKAELPSNSKKPAPAYCPYIASPKTYSPSITVTGHATYEYRNDGNGIIPDGTNAYAPVVPVGGATTSFALTVNGTTLSYTCNSPCTVLKAVNGLATATGSVALAATGVVFTYNMTALAPYRSSGTGVIALSSPTNMVALNARPIRYAEVQVTKDDGTIVQCAETDALGDFTLNLPSGGARYTVGVMSRSSNVKNTTYVMTNPTDNVPYKIAATVQSAVSTSVTVKALATGALEGAAFNILDQIANAQFYLREKTKTCDSVSSIYGNYFAGCIPVTTIPLVNAYWAPGLTPAVYYGGTGGISYYLNGVKELYILGGISGDTKVTDMDHFDNSVIVHEYAHFIEDQFGKPNSPGGSHSGSSIIDPRLAWGEGWANYFQAAVSGIPIYRDTTGYVCTTGCTTGVAFAQPLESGTQFSMSDQASQTGEGNFREFSVSRLLWAISKPSGISQFSEVWTALNGTAGMRAVADVYKAIGRFHVIHNSIAAATDWSTVVTNEKHAADFSGYATPFSIAPSCTTATSNPMSIVVTGSDDGSFARSNQFSNNDFYIYSHPGGVFNASISWAGASQADLDLYIYKAGYVYGDSGSTVALDNAETTSSAGLASVSKSLTAGTYIINVMAYTGVYSSNGTYSTAYTLNVAGHAACPSAL